MKLNYNKLRQPIWRNGSLTWENFAVLAIALLACNMAQAATSAHRMAAVTTGTTSGFPVIAEGIISWVKTLAGAGCGWGVYDKVGGGRDIQSTLKDGALPMAGLGMVAAPNPFGPQMMRSSLVII